MSQFNYNILLTGDCSNLGNGAISILPYGGTPPYTVDWYSPNLGADVISVSPSVRTSLSSGNYAVRLNDSTLPTNFEFFVNIPLSDGVCANIESVKGTTCNTNNGSVTATTTSDYSSANYFLYTSTGGYLTSGTTNNNNFVFNSLSAGTYYIIAQDLGGCTGKSQTFVVEPSESFDYGLWVVPNAACGANPIGKIYVTGQTGQQPYTYFWSTSETTSFITGLTQGSYSVTVTDSYGCSVTKEATITQIPPVGFGSFSAQTPNCFQNNGAIRLNITGGTAPFYYSASTGDFTISYSDFWILSGLSSGGYSFSVTDAGLCNFVASTQLLSPQGMSSVQISGINSNCSANDGSITISVTDGTSPYIYTLVYPTGDTDIISSNLTSYIFQNLTAGTYTVFVEDQSGCSFSQPVTILTDNKFTFSTDITPTTCGVSNGSIVVTKSTGGTAPFDYSLDNTVNILDTNLSAVTFNNVSSGLHTVSITDATGCKKQSQIFVPSSSPIAFTLYTTSCGAGNQGSITAFISSGEPPFTYNWSSNIISNPQQIIASGLTAGTYSITITDNNGCSLTRSTNITCTQSYASYQIYVMGCEEVQTQSGTKYGLLQMLNEGFNDLTSGNTACSLVSAQFQTKVSVEPLGTVSTDIFFTSTTINQAPSDNLWFDSVKSVLTSILGVSNVTIDPNTNQITIETANGSPISNQQIIIELVIIYDIICTT